jgi:HD superfamily phosphohydrolase
MSKMCDNLIPQGKIKKDDLQVLRVSALLHDIGHYPFSHAIERNLSKDDERLKHNNIGIELIKKSEICGILSKNNIDVTDVEKILRKKMSPDYPVYSYLLDSDLDIDKMDYLLRDSLHTGVAYGSIDVDRLIRTITVDNDGTLAVREKGKQAVENLMIARYHMYQTVYFHKAVAAFELMLTKIYGELLKEKCVFTKDEILKKVEENQSAEICEFDDSYVFHAMRAYKGDNALLKEMIGMIFCRQPLSKVCEESAFTESKKSASVLSLLEIPVQKETCATKAGVNSEWIFLNKVPSIRFSESPIKVEKDGGFISMDEDETSIAHIIAKHSYTSYRVYTKEKFKDSVRKAIRECYAI